MSYKLIIHPKAEKEFNKIQTGLGSIIIKKIYDLAENPFPAGYKKLSGFKSDRTAIKQCYRIRVGDYRVYIPSNKKLLLSLSYKSKSVGIFIE